MFFIFSLSRELAVNWITGLYYLLGRGGKFQEGVTPSLSEGLFNIIQQTRNSYRGLNRGFLDDMKVLDKMNDSTLVRKLKDSGIPVSGIRTSLLSSDDSHVHFPLDFEALQVIHYCWISSFRSLSERVDRWRRGSLSNHLFKQEYRDTYIGIYSRSIRELREGRIGSWSRYSRICRSCDLLRNEEPLTCPIHTLQLCLFNESFWTEQKRMITYNLYSHSPLPTRCLASHSNIFLSYQMPCQPFWLNEISFNLV